VISASNADLHPLISEGRFREDLYFRLCVLTLSLPPLRERMEDLPLLAEHLLRRLGAVHKFLKCKLAGDALHKLMEYNWPGNVRELENLLERALVLSRGGAIQAKHIELPEIPMSRPKNPVPRTTRFPSADQLMVHNESTRSGNGTTGSHGIFEGSFASLKARAIYEFEHAFLEQTLAKFGGNIARSAEAAGKHRRAFFELLRKHHLAGRPQHHPIA
jgi:two-component system, NtrC family, response regulator GlrR